MSRPRPDWRLAIAIRIQCPSPGCGAVCSAAEAANGRSVKCPKCGVAYVARPTFDGRSGDTPRNPPSPNEDPFPTLPARFGRYRVLRLLGRGGMGAVYLAEDSQLGRRVALKIPFFDARTSPQRLERFAREARSAAGLDHPNICTVYDTGEVGGRPYLTMRYVQGASLEAENERADGLPQARAAEVARQVARALDFAHRAGVIHRDLKPANVMVAAGGEPVVMDFGLAKMIADADPSEAKLTREGGVIGTPSYMSPEQIRGDAAIGPASDIYSLGVMLFELLTGETPYRGSVGVVMGQALAAPVRSVWELQPDADPRLEAACRRAMAKEPAARHPTMAAFAEALDAYLKAPNAPPPPPAEVTKTFDQMASAPAPARPKPKRRRVPGVVLAVALALGAAAAAAAAAVVLRLETKDGTLLVEIDDPEVEARFKAGALTLCGPDGKVRYTLTAGERGKKLPAGPYTVRVEGADGLALDTPEFTLKRGEKVTVKVTLERPAVAGAAPAAKWTAPRVATYRNKFGMAFVPVPRGRSWLGGEGVMPGSQACEVKDDFFLGQSAVTQGEWRQVLGTSPSHFARNGEGKARVEDVPDEDLLRHPVETVSWVACREFVARLNALAEEPDWTYRMPTEVEWEYACRGGPLQNPSQSAFAFDFGKPAHEIAAQQANFNAGSAGRTSRVDAYPPGRLGLYDMHGNVHQWCDDSVSSSGGPGETHRAVRGGSFYSPAYFCRATNRFHHEPTDARFNIGLRVARVPGGVAKVPSGPAAAPPAAGFTALFNGKNLDGWVPHPRWPGKWSVEGGVLTGRPDGGPLGFPHQSYLRTARKDYTDFHLRVEARVKLGNKGGVLVRVGDGGEIYPSTTDRWIKGYDIDIEARRGEPTWTGGIMCGNYILSPPTPPTAKPGEWFVLDVIVSGWDITVKVDGRVVNTFTDNSRRSAAGFLSLQSFGSNSVIEFRRVEVQDLAAGKVAAAAPAAAPAAAVPAADPDRKAAEYVLSVGGTVWLNGKQEVKALADLPKGRFDLTTVWLRDCVAVTDAGLAACAGVTKLNHLDLVNTRVTERGLSYFKDCPKLGVLDLVNTPTTDDGLAHFHHCKGLGSLWLWGTRVTDKGLAGFAGYRSLYQLDLRGTGATDAGLANFKGCANLIYLGLDGTKVTDAALLTAKGFPKLKDASLLRTATTAKAVAELRDALPNAKVAWDGPAAKK